MEFNELIRDLKCIARYHIPGTEMRKDVDDVVERVVYLLEAQQARIAELEAELKEEMYRHDRVQDFEVAEAQELAKLREERRWIPVEERLPDKEFWEHQKRFDDDLEVMVMIKGAKLPTTLCYTADGDFYAMAEDGVTFYLVTHWKPMPEPPEEVG